MLENMRGERVREEEGRKWEEEGREGGGRGGRKGEEEGEERNVRDHL